MRTAGFTLLELVFVVGLVTTVSAAVVPSVSTAIDHYRTLGAVRYVASRLQRTRMDAVTRGFNSAMRFTVTGTAYTFSVYVDGNGDGVRSADIDRGIDRLMLGPEQLSEQFAGVEFGALPGIPAVDGSSSPPGSDPIRIGSARMASFTPVGTSTSGSLYILGPHHAQFVVRIYGETGKTRILEFNTRTRVWSPL
jgi:type II secretory pathway pseudopilin PulG